MTLCICFRHLETQHPQQFLDVKSKSLRMKKAETAASDATDKASGMAAMQAALARGKMQPAVRTQHNRRLMLWCVLDMRPFNVSMGLGFDLFVGGLAPLYAAEKMNRQTLVNMMTEEYFAVKGKVIDGLRTQWESMGGSGPFCSLQMDMTTTNNVAFCTINVSYISKADSGKFELTKVNLVTRSFPHDHKAVQIEDWVKHVTNEFFGGFMPEGFDCKDVYNAGTVDQGGNVANAISNLRIPLLYCAAHCLNSSVQWGLGIAGTIDKQKTCKNLKLRGVMGRAAGLISHFSYSSPANDKMKEIQASLSETGCEEVLDMVRFNYTRWSGRHASSVRLLELAEPLMAYCAKLTGKNADISLSGDDWLVLREVTSVMDMLQDVTTKIQGGRDRFVSQTVFLMQELISLLEDETIDIRDEQAQVTERVSTERLDLHELTIKMLEVVVDEMRNRNLGSPRTGPQLLCMMLDPRYKDTAFPEDGRDRYQQTARKALSSEYDKFAQRQGTRATSAAAGGGNASAEQPAAKAQCVPGMSALQKRQAQRKAEYEAAQAAQASAATVSITNEVTQYLQQPVIKDFDNDFDLLQFWEDAGRDQVDTSVTPPRVIKRAEYPILAQMARGYFSIDGTSCESERTFSTLALTLDDLRGKLTDSKVEMMMFLKMNRHFIAECRELEDRIAARASLKASTAAAVDASVTQRLAEQAASQSETS